MDNAYYFSGIDIRLPCFRVDGDKQHAILCYQIIGYALENEHWVNIASNEKGRLLMELEGCRELEEMLKSEGMKIEI